MAWQLSNPDRIISSHVWVTHQRVTNDISIILGVKSFRFPCPGTLKHLSNFQSRSKLGFASHTLVNISFIDNMKRNILQLKTFLCRLPWDWQVSGARVVRCLGGDTIWVSNQRGQSLGLTESDRGEKYGLDVIIPSTDPISSQPWDRDQGYLAPRGVAAGGRSGWWTGGALINPQCREKIERPC